MSAVDDLFRRLSTQRRKALMPFVTAGDPDCDYTRRLIPELIRRGASMVELGVPYSDPIADGPVIQASYTRALRRGIKLTDTLQIAADVTRQIDAPVVSMVSYAIVLRHGLERYVDQAQRAGMAGAVVPDLPVEEADRLADVCREADFSLIQLVTPTTTRERQRRIAAASTGFLYYVSVTGVTGERTELPDELLENVNWLREQTDTPVCVGFGVSRPEHVRALAAAADGLIVGSAIVRRIHELADHPVEESIRQVGEFVESLVNALP